MEHIGGDDLCRRYDLLLKYQSALGLVLPRWLRLEPDQCPTPILDARVPTLACQYWPTR